METTEQAVQTSYLVFPMPDGNQAESWGNYLTRHGREAFSASNEVTCPTLGAEDCAAVYQLFSHWKLFWRYSEKELYGLPSHFKPACEDHQ